MADTRIHAEVADSSTPAAQRLSSRARWLVGVFGGWTIFIWVTRIENIWGDAAASTGSKIGSTVLASAFVGLGVVLVALAVVRRWHNAAPAITAVAAVATVAVWLVRSTSIVLADHDVAFVAVHLALGVVSVVLGYLAWKAVRTSTRSAVER